MDLQEKLEKPSDAPQCRASSPARRKQEADEVLGKTICKLVPFA